MLLLSTVDTPNEHYEARRSILLITQCIYKYLFTMRYSSLSQFHSLKEDSLYNIKCVKTPCPKVPLTIIYICPYLLNANTTLKL